MNYKNRKPVKLDYWIIGLFLIAVSVLTVGYFTEGWFCVEYQNVDEEDSGNRCFQKLSSLKEFNDYMIEKYDLGNQSTQYTDYYISDTNVINHNGGNNNYSVDFYDSTGKN